MRVLFITNYAFPFGMAQTNRLIAMSKGLLHAGAKVQIIVSKANIVLIMNNNKLTKKYFIWIICYKF